MARPIFMMGFPKSISQDKLDDASDHLSKLMKDYHVIVVRNTKEGYIAKVYSEKGSEIFDVENVKQLLNK